MPRTRKSARSGRTLSYITYYIYILHLGDDFVYGFSGRDHRQNVCVGAYLAVDYNCSVHVESLFQCRFDVLALCDPHSLNSEGVCQLYKVGRTVRICLREAVAIKELLPLANHAEHGVVHYENDNGQAV